MLEATKLLQGNTDATFSLSLASHLSYTSQKRCYTLMATIAKVTSPDSPAWRPEGFTIVALQLYISVYFKGYCLRVWLPVSLKLRAE